MVINAERLVEFLFTKYSVSLIITLIAKSSGAFNREVIQHVITGTIILILNIGSGGAWVKKKLHICFFNPFFLRLKNFWNIKMALFGQELAPESISETMKHQVTSGDVMVKKKESENTCETQQNVLLMEKKYNKYCYKAPQGWRGILDSRGILIHQSLLYFSFYPLCLSSRTERIISPKFVAGRIATKRNKRTTKYYSSEGVCLFRNQSNWMTFKNLHRTTHYYETGRGYLFFYCLQCNNLKQFWKVICVCRWK